MTHFLLGLTCLGLTAIVVLEAWSVVGGLARPAGPRWLRQVVTWAGIPTCMALVVTGAVATASGPHPGADDNVERLGLGIRDTVYVHVRVAAVFGIGVLLLGHFLWRLRDRYPGLLRVWGSCSRPSSRRRSSVRRNTGTLCPGGSCSSTSSSPRRSGRSASRSRSLCGARLPHSPASKLRR